MTMSAASIRNTQTEICDFAADVIESLEEAIITRLKNRDRISVDPRDLPDIEINYAEFCEDTVGYSAQNAIEYLEALLKDATSIEEVSDDWKDQLIAAANATVVAAVERVTKSVFEKLQDAVDEWYEEYKAAEPFAYEFTVTSDHLEISIMTDKYDVTDDDNVWGVIYVAINY